MFSTRSTSPPKSAWLYIVMDDDYYYFRFDHMLIQIDMMTHVVYMRWFDRSGDVCVLDKEVVGVHRAQRETI